ncbi:MAG: PAS domain S-box protein [Calditrichota bacterium]
MRIFHHSSPTLWGESNSIRTALKYMGIYLILGTGWIVLFHLIVDNVNQRITPLHHVYWEEFSFIFIVGILLFLFFRKVAQVADDSDEALKKEQALVDSIIKTSPIGITAVDHSGFIIFANTRAGQVLGLTSEGIVSRTYNDPGWHITDLEGKPLPEEELPFIQVLQSGKPVYDCKHAIEWPGGHRVLLSVNGSPLFNGQGEIDRVIFAIADITAQKEADQQLLNTTERLHALIEASPLAIAMMTPDQKVDSVWNRAAEQMFGLTQKEAEEGPFLEIPQKWQPEYQAILEKVLQGKSFTGIELPHLTPSGAPIDLEIHIAPVRNDAGRIVNVMAVFEDITKQKKTDKELCSIGRYGRPFYREMSGVEN